MTEVQDLELLQAARCEDLMYEQISKLTILGDFELNIVNTLKMGGAHLLEGARGVGKSMLLRQAEIEMDKEFQSTRKLAVYVTFKTSTLLEGIKAGQRDAFQAWVGTKILEALHEKLLMLDLIKHDGVVDPYHRLFGIESPQGTKTYLQEKIHQLQKLAVAENKESILNQLGTDFLDRVNDVSFLIEIIKEIAESFNINRIIFLFDEAAHTFIPSQQEIFFEIFKLLHGGLIAVKAAVYPSITSYGKNFEVGQDAIVLPMDRFEPSSEGLRASRTLFRRMLEQRLPKTSSIRKRIFERGQILDLCIDLSTGNPRAFLHLLNRVFDKGSKSGFSERAVLLAAQDFVDKELLPYHSNLSKRLPKYSRHVGIGIRLLKEYIIPEIRVKNFREKQTDYQSAFFTVRRDMSPNLNLALNILCYSGVLTNKGTVAVSDKKTGVRYMVHLAFSATEKIFSQPDLMNSIRLLNIKYPREFAGNDPGILTYLSTLKETAEQCINCSVELPPNAKFCSECGTKVQPTSIISGLLEEPVNSLPITDKLKDRIRNSFPKVGDVVQAKREDLMAIPYIKEVRSRIIKNAADEFISG